MTILTEAKRIVDQTIDPIVNEWKERSRKIDLNAYVRVDETIISTPDEHLNIKLVLEDPVHDILEEGIVEVHDHGVLKFRTTGFDTALRAVGPRQTKERFETLFEVMQKTLMEKRDKLSVKIA